MRHVLHFHNFNNKLKKKKTYMYTMKGFSGSDYVLIILFQLYGSKGGFLKVIYSGWVNMTPQPSYWKKN